MAASEFANRLANRTPSNSDQIPYPKSSSVYRARKSPPHLVELPAEGQALQSWWESHSLQGLIKCIAERQALQCMWPSSDRMSDAANCVARSRDRHSD